MSTPAPQSAGRSQGPLLDVRDLRVGFTQYTAGLRRREVVAVADMSLRVAPGEVVGLIGASGAGKSLLAHAILSLLPRNARCAGEIAWRGEPVDDAARRRLAGIEIALLPQSLTHLDPTSRLGAQVRRSARLAGAGDPTAAARAALADRGLDDAVERRFAHQVSGGQGRRVLAAMASLGDPALVVADEPTPGLDPPEVRAVLDRLHALAEAGAGVLLITHDLPAALTVVDRVVVCREGRTVDDVPVAALTDGAAGAAGAEGAGLHPYTRALWQALPGNDFATRAC